MSGNNMWKGANFKKVEDHSSETKELLDRVHAELEANTRHNEEEAAHNSDDDSKVDSLVEEILALEKVSRLGGDVPSNEKLAVEALRIYRVRNDINKMLQTLDLLMRKRAQTKHVQSAMIAECSVILEDKSISEEREEEVLQRLAHATDNKIHVELEHARFTIELARRREAAGQKRAASDMLQALQIETITNMPRVEKLNAINQQIRLTIELDDIEHTPLVSRKINFRALGRAEARSQKLQYFELMRAYYTKKGSHFNVARCWYETYLTQQDAQDKSAALSNAAVHYLIAEHSSAKEIEDLAECCAFAPTTKLANRVSALQGIAERLRTDLEDLPQVYNLLRRFNSIELIRERVAGDVQDLCATHPELAPFPERQERLRNRCSEHDLIVISHFYTRIHLARLAQLVGLSVEHTESFIMTMVGNKTLYAKMDRVDGLVVFEIRKNTTEVITTWNEAVERSVALLDKVSHLITKERMLHNVPSSSSKNVLQTN